MPAKMKMGRHDEDYDGIVKSDGDGTSFEKYFNTNYSAEFMSGLPERIRQRAQVLMHYHEEYEKLRKSFEEKETALRRKYDEIYLPLYERRKEIVTGSRAPTEEEVAKGFPSEHEGRVDINDTAADNDKSVAGLPGFWLRVLQNHVLSKSLIEEYDEEVLSHLTDVRSGVLEGDYGNFAVVFVFEPNPFFEEESLMLGLVHNDDGVKIIRSPLTWKPGKDVTVERITKKGGGKGGKGGKGKKPVTVTVSRPSFFAMFKETSNKSDDEDDADDDEGMNDEIEQLLHVLHNSIIPCAVNFYTGEAPDGSSDIDTEDYDDDEEEEEEEEEDEMPPRKGQKSQGGRGNNPDKECKQQ